MSSPLEPGDAHHPQEEERKFRCSECGRGYRHAGSLTNHRRTHEVGSFQCTICGKENWNASAMKNHLRSHASSRKYSCAGRGKSFRSEAQLLTHERVHLSQTSERQSHRSNELEISKRRDERGPKPEANEDLNSVWVPAESVPEDVCNSPPAVDRPFRCSLCEKSYIHLRSLINHKKTHQLGMFECTVCFKLCNNMGALYSHQRTHKASVEKEPDPFPLQNHHAPGNFCHLCEVLFPSSTEFQDHIQMHNSSSQSFPEQVNVYKPGACSPESGFCASPAESLPHSVPQGGTQTPPSSGGATSAEETPAKESDERPFKCHTCGKSYRHSGSLINHKRSHQVGVFHCSVCSKKYPHLAALRSHLRLHRARRPSFLLHAEGDWLSPEPLTLDGQQQAGEAGDQENVDVGGGGGFSDQDATPRLQPRHVCADCGETFADIPGIKSHSLSCPALQRHLAVVDQDDSVTFDPRNGGGTSDGNLSRNHLEDVSAAPPNGGGEGGVPDEDDGDHYQCSVCGNSYTTMMALRSHLRGHTQSDDAPQSSGPPSLSSLEGERGGEPGEMMICSTCGETFVNRQEDLITHLLLHKQSEADRHEGLPATSEVPDSKEETSIICSRCGISCSSLQSLRSHGCTADEKDVKVEDVRPDAETAGGEERKYRCDQCGRSYRHAGSLLNHKKSHKTGVFRCTICQKRFYNLLALKNHQRSHFDVKRHTCGECGKAFKVQKQLLNHLRRHKQNPAKVQELNGQVQMLPLSDGSRPPPACGAGQQPQDDERPFSCEQCGRTYRHAGSLVNHRNSHKTGEYYCSVCRNVYTNQLAMKNHLRSHFAYKKHLCQNCGKGFRRKKQLLAHVCAELRKGGATGRTGLRSRTFRCKDCKRDFLSADTLSAHACAGTPRDEERPFACNICHRSYRHAGSLLNHKNTHKTGHFSCAFCSKPFSNPMALRSHTRIHTQKKKHACPTCGKAFRLASVLRSHQRVHSRAAVRFSCSSCGESFRGRPGLRRHRCRRGQGVNAPSGVHPTDGADKCFMCDLCGRSYHHAGYLLNHKKSHSEDLHQCTFCLQTFPDPLRLQLHSQERRHCCPECGKTFCLVAHLQSHIEVHSRNTGGACGGHPELHAAQGEDEPAEDHRCWDPGANQSAGPVPTGEVSVPEEKSHVCEHCGRAYRHAGSLLNHKNSHKTGRFLCSLCQKEFTNLMALRNHRRIHTEPKRYQCLTCGKAFRVSTQLICHRRIHTKEKPFGCPLCSKSFSSKSNLRHHQKIHQNQNPSYTYEPPFNMEADAFMNLDLESFL